MAKIPFSIFIFIFFFLTHPRAHTHKVTSFHWRHLTTVIPAECLSQTVSAKQREERPQHDLLWLNCSGDYLVFKIRVTHTHNTHTISLRSPHDKVTKGLTNQKPVSICLSVCLSVWFWAVKWILQGLFSLIYAPITSYKVFSHAKPHPRWTISGSPKCRRPMSRGLQWYLLSMANP